MNWMNRLLMGFHEGDTLKGAQVKYPKVINQEFPYGDKEETPYMAADDDSYVLENIVHAESFMNQDWELEHRFPVTVWTNNWIYFTVHTRYGFFFHSIPRNPTLEYFPTICSD